jgi:two-component system, OmpR family, KDP operon response regulator KdpE
MNENTIILIIDDEPQIRRLLDITISAHGYKVIQSATGKDGLIDAATFHPSL